MRFLQRGQRGAVASSICWRWANARPTAPNNKQLASSTTSIGTLLDSPGSAGGAAGRVAGCVLRVGIDVGPATLETGN